LDHPAGERTADYADFVRLLGATAIGDADDCRKPFLKGTKSDER
jgi:hypothetical protein